MSKWFVRGLSVCMLVFLVAAMPWAVRLYEPIEKNNKALRALEAKEYDRAIEYLSQARQQKPDDDVIRRNLAVAYNSKALDLDRNGREIDALRYYEHALDVDPSNSIVMRNLVATLNNLAVERSRGRKFLEAQQLFEKAGVWLGKIDDRELVQSIRANYAGLLTVWGAELLKHNKPEAAAESFRQALSLNPKNAVAMIYLGDIAYEVNDYETARSFYSAARRIDSENAAYLDARLAMIDKESKVEAAFREATDRHQLFRLQYVPYSSGVSVAEILAMLSDAHETLGQKLGLRPTRSVNVKLYRAEDFFRVSGLPAWATGIYDGKMRLKVEDMDNAPSQVRDLLFHEYTHALLAMNIRQPLPAWFHEGLAQLMEPQFAQSEREQRRLRAALTDGKLSFDALADSFKDLPSKAEAEQAYLLSKYFLATLVNRYGEGKLRAWLARLVSEEKFEEAFERVYGMPLKKAQESWIAEQLESLR